jgi:TolB-like protein
VATGAVALAAMVTALAIWLIHIHAPVKPVALALMPFRNLSGDSSDDYLGDGISEELTETLSEFDYLRVVTRTSAFQYKGKRARRRMYARSAANWE